LGHVFYGSVAKRSLQQNIAKHYPKIHGQTKGVVALSPIRNTPPTVLDQYKLTYSVIHSGVARILIQEGTACMLTKSGRNHRSIYINRINCKAENCQIGVNALAPGGTCPVPRAPCPMAGDANHVNQCIMHGTFSFAFSSRYAKTRTSNFRKVVRQHTESMVGSIVYILLEIYLSFQQ